MVVKTAQVWTQSKIARKMLCFKIETAAGGREEGYVRRTVAGYARAMFGPCPREIAMTGEFRARGKESNA